MFHYITVILMWTLIIYYILQIGKKLILSKITDICERDKIITIIREKNNKIEGITIDKKNRKCKFIEIAKLKKSN